jgi:Zn-dependent membrane protease YugP
MFFDPMYFVFIAPAMLLSLWAQFKVKSAFSQGDEFRPMSGLSGAETAQRILEMNGLQHDVSIEQAHSFLGDHYDPRSKVLRLSPQVYSGRTLSAMGVAAHEVGHAIQHAHHYRPLTVRNAIVPAAMVSSNLAWILIMIGLVMSPLRFLAPAGVILFGVTVLFQMITLPVEYDASRRARAILVGNGMVTREEDVVVGKVLNAAGLTYIAAALTSLLQLLYFVSLVSSRRN